MLKTRNKDDENFKRGEEKVEKEKNATKETEKTNHKLLERTRERRD